MADDGGGGIEDADCFDNADSGTDDADEDIDDANDADGDDDADDAGADEYTSTISGTSLSL
jgi:hypothetical protein